MNDAKSLLLSRTFWGALTAVLAGILGLFGYVLSPEDANALIDLIAGLAAAAGGLLAIFGRVKASKRIA